MNIDITSMENKNVMWAVCHAVNGASETKLIQKNSKTDNPKSYDIVFTVCYKVYSLINCYPH